MKPKIKTVMSLQSFCNTDHIISGNSEDVDKSLKSLQNKSLFLVDSKGEIEIAHVDIENDTFNKINRQKELILLIQAVCSSNQTCTVSANDKTETVPSYSSLASFHNILFVFPADTRELILKVKGKPGTVLAIKDIQIWQ